MPRTTGRYLQKGKRAGAGDLTQPIVEYEPVLHAQCVLAAKALGVTPGEWFALAARKELACSRVEAFHLAHRAELKRTEHALRPDVTADEFKQKWPGPGF